jgi:hypothetical protein
MNDDHEQHELPPEESEPAAVMADVF